MCQAVCRMVMRMLSMDSVSAQHRHASTPAPAPAPAPPPAPTPAPAAVAPAAADLKKYPLTPSLPQHDGTPQESVSQPLQDSIMAAWGSAKIVCTTAAACGGSVSSTLT